jgi:hypothetical protein
VANTLTLQNSINWSQTFGGWRGLALGVQNEPAITCANIILQTMLGAPFCWNWNRSSVQFLTTIGIQDYVTVAASFGFIEKASYVLASRITNTALTANVATYTSANSFAVGTNVTITGTTNGAGVFNIINQPIVSATSTQFTIAITNSNIGSASDTGTAVLNSSGVTGSLTEISNVINVLGSGNELGTPAYIAPQVDDNAGNITFRILAIPDQVYQITIVYQKRIPALMNSLGSTWAPIPDHYSFIYQYGFLALIAAYFSDNRYGFFSQKFVAGLLGAAEGLSEDQKNVFSRAWYNSVTEQQFTNLRTEQGVQGLGR